MAWGRVAETEFMPRLVGGNYFDKQRGKLKSGNRFLKPNFELGPNHADRLIT